MILIVLLNVCCKYWGRMRNSYEKLVIVLYKMSFYKGNIGRLIRIFDYCKR